MAEHPNAVLIRGLYESGSDGDMSTLADAPADDIVFDDASKISAFWALIDDTAAFDEFFA
jgi:hypothetical protein